MKTNRDEEILQTLTDLCQEFVGVTMQHATILAQENLERFHTEGLKLIESVANGYAITPDDQPRIRKRLLKAAGYSQIARSL